MTTMPRRQSMLSTLFDPNQTAPRQGCQMVYFHTKISIWEYFGRLEIHNVGSLYNHLVFLWTFGIFHGQMVGKFCCHLVYFGMLYRENLATLPHAGVRCPPQVIAM
jgi:hypothetical protein